jgi:hypothetical protein
MRKIILGLLLCGIVVGRASEPWPNPAGERFVFAAIGCVPYARAPRSVENFTRLIAEINHVNPAFTVHLGDTKGSEEACTDEFYVRRREDFNTFDGPLIYTPGDNEWTDSHYEKAGKWDPVERLGRLREIYFAEERSFGRRPLPLVTQRRDEKFAKFVENARWTHGGVVFATVHAVGSDNNNQPDVPGAVAEFEERDAADAAWIRAAFAEARASAALGVVLFFQADPLAADFGRPGVAKGFDQFLRVISAEARAWAKPVLLVHADEHRYRLDVGVQLLPDEAALPNVTRLETFGEWNVHGAIVVVDPDSPQLFLCGPLVVPGNPVPQLPRPWKKKP